jgi:hypothetical protein
MNFMTVWPREGVNDASPPFRGEREGPAPKAWEGGVGVAANPFDGPPHPTVSPRPAGGEGNKSDDN